MIDRETSPWIQRNGRNDFTQGIDGLITVLNRESRWHHFDVDDRRKNTHGDVVRLGKSRTGLTDSRQPENRHRQACTLGMQQALLGHELAPWIAQQSQRENPFHVGEVRLHLVLDAAAGELSCEGTEVLRKDAHGRGVEQVLGACAQAQFQDAANAESIDLPDGGVGRSQGQIGGKMVDGVDPMTQRIETRFAQTESRFRHVTDHHADARRQRLFPDFSLLQGFPQALESMFDVVRSDKAVHHQIGFLTQQLTQEETADESRGAGQQDLSKMSWRDRIGPRSLAGRCMNESTQTIEVPPALRWQRAGQRSHGSAVGGSFGHDLVPSIL